MAAPGDLLLELLRAGRGDIRPCESRLRAKGRLMGDATDDRQTH